MKNYLKSIGPSSDDPDANTISDTSSFMMQSSSSNKGSITHVQAKKHSTIHL
ncbi:MAG: hypothetical protein L0H53_08360 [Candidatus Nitrosocosmicus sp.]|nr:hypothetical protein [Candidatus Nitrosocosmicus sp.]MDN5867361.1 hypothetical protein [Candidatus Nitrosocosmicus sp.]